MMRPGNFHWRDPFRWLRKHGRLAFCLIALPLMALLVFSLNLFNIGGISSSVEQVYFRFVTHTTQKILSNRIRLVYMDAEHNKKLIDANQDLKDFMTDDLERQLWRRLHAKLITKLEKAGAAVVAFDFRFPSTGVAEEGANRKFLQALRNDASEGRTSVVIGEIPGENTDEALRQVSSLKYGNLWIGGKVTDASNRQIVNRVAVAISDGRSANGMSAERPEKLMPMPFLLFLNAEWPESPSISYGLDAGGRDITIYQKGTPVRHIHTQMDLCRVHDQNCEVPHGFDWQRMALLPLVMPVIDSRVDVPYQDVLDAQDLSDYKGKIVIVGARYKEEEVSIPGSETGTQFYGYQVHAAILSDLLRDTYPRYPGPFSQLLIFFALAGMAVLGRRWLPVKDIKVNTFVFGERQVPSGLLILILIYGIGGVVAYSSDYLVLNVTYDLTLLVVAYFAYGRKSPAAAEPAGHVGSRPEPSPEGG